MTAGSAPDSATSSTWSSMRSMRWRADQLSRRTPSVDTTYWYANAYDVQPVQFSLSARATFAGSTVVGGLGTSTAWKATATARQPVQSRASAKAMLLLSTVGPGAATTSTEERSTVGR
jgi:hypothetical protein